mmetsp:Transcript_117656/g.234423  ORF Transcript_117656/g.234423 Transcript_117656/m.234423 type:complete len:90 (-) Transcript_117656:11-280(-)
MLPGSGVNLQGLLLRPGGFHSRGVSPDDSLVEGLRVEAHADAPGHAAGATSEASSLCRPRFHVAALSSSLMEGMLVTRSNAMRVEAKIR